VVLNAVCDADLLPVIDERTRAGRLTVYEINDDFRAVQPANPIAGFFASAANRRVLFRLAHRAGRVQFTVPELDRLYGYFAPSRAIFANQLLDIPERRSVRPAGPVVIGWGGSKGHLDDVRRIEPALTRFLRAHDDVRFRLMGADAIAALLKDLPKDRFEHVPAGNIEAYHAFVSSLDIGLAPLENDGFNRSRSDVKFLEYAAHGVVPVVQRLEPYLASVRHGENGFLFDTPEELVAGWRAHEGVEPEGRLTLMNATAYEDLLHEGLMRGQRAKQHAAAASSFERAAALVPQDHLPWLLRGATTGDEKALRKAVELEPKSIVSRMALGGVLADRRDQECLQHFLAAAEIDGAYEAPFVAVSQFFESLGLTKEAQEFMGIAVRSAANFEEPA